MTSEELAESVVDCIESVRERIIGTGDEQYSLGDTQRIETKSNNDILKEAIEELDDLIVYVAVLRNRVAQLRNAI